MKTRIAERALVDMAVGVETKEPDAAAARGALACLAQKRFPAYITTVKAIETAALAALAEHRPMSDLADEILALIYALDGDGNVP